MPKEEVRHLGEKRHGAATEKKRETFERDYSQYDFKFPTDRYEYVLKPGLSREVIEEISSIKNEPKWMREFRLQAYEIFLKKPMPTWGADLSAINFDTITYYATPTDKSARSWDDVPEEVKKTFDRLGIPEAERKFLAGVGAQYDCLTADTIVFANPGAVPIAQIQPGQFVYSLEPRSRKIIKQRVLAVVEKGLRPVFEVKVAGRRLKATYNHPFLALTHHKEDGKQQVEVQWRYLSDLQVGDYIAIVKQLPDEGQPYRLPAVDCSSVYTGRNQICAFSVRTEKLFRRQQQRLKLPEYTSEPFMWFLGAYLGDGGLRRKSKGGPKTYVDIAFPASDQPCRARLAEVLKEAFGYEIHFDQDPYRVRIRCRPIVRLLEALGLDAQAKTKAIPSWAFGLPRSQKLALIAGYIDSDGHVRGNENNSDATLTSANEALLRDIQRLAITCGLRVSTIYPFCSKTTYKGQTTERTAYRLMLMGDLRSLLPYSVKVATYYKPRKYYHKYNSCHRISLGAHTSDDIGFAPIESIRYVGFEPTYDIEVEGAHNFVAEGIIVHNSEVLYHSIREDLKKKGVIFLSMDDGLREYPDLVKEYFGTVIPPTDNKFAALNSAVWSGGCLTAEARLFTQNGGIKSIAEIQPGDRVLALSPKGELVPAQVIAHIHSGRKPVYRFRVAGRTLEATSNHMFLTLEKSPVPLNRFGRKWGMVWKPLADLRVGDVIAIAKRLPWQGESKPLPPLPPYRKNHHLQRSLRAPTRTNPDLMWLLGVWMGDGNTYAPHPHMRFINFALPKGDPARPEAIRLLRKLFNYPVKTQTPVSFTVYSKALGEWLAGLGFIGKAKTKRIPPWVFGLPLEERLAFLGGLLDADGWVEHQGKTVCFELANKQLIEDIKLLAISCGLFSDGKIRERHRRSAMLKQEQRHIVSGATYVCRITGQVALIGSRNPRWRALLDQAQKRTLDKYTTVTGENFSSLATEDIGFAPIREKEYIGVRDVYDIQVEEHANFVANGIIAHNSFIYVPKGVQVDIPLQAYFRINAPQMGQFERTLIIADEGARVHYIEGCLPGGEQVSVGDRWVNIESLKPGDYVIADNGLKARVRATMVRPYRGEMLTIKPISPYNAFRLTPEHPVLVVRRANVLTKRRARNGWLPEVATEKLLAAQPEYVPAGELTVGDFLVFPKVQPEGHNPTYTPELLKLLGYYLAEGSAFVHKSLNMPVVSFSFGAHERETIAEVCQLIEWVTDKKPCVTEIPKKHAVNVVVYSQELMDLCVESCGKGAATKRLSPELMALPAEQIKPLLEAYFRGDGNVCDKGNSIYRAATASETLAQQLQELLARLGIYASIQVRRGGEDRIQGRTIHRQDQYIVAYTVDKRWSEIRQTERYFLVPIKEIERAPYEGFVFNLDVEGPNSYLVRGFAVHNCTAPIYSKESLHSAVVELIAKRGAHLRYTTLQNWSNDVYNLVTKRAVAYEDATVEWVDANIGCLTADTKVFLNPRGAVNITEIKPYDHVYALDLNAMEIVKRPVKGVVCTGIKPVFKLTTENHREIKATANHPFLALQRSGKHWQMVWKPLEHLQVGDYIALSQGLPDEGKPYRIDYQPLLKRTRVKPQLPRETSEDLMWLLGLYLGDGFIERGKNNVPRRVYFAIPEGDPARPKLTELLQKLFSVDWKPKGISVTVNSAILSDFLLSLGFSGTAREKRIPRWVFGLPRRQKLAFIEGYLDADGHIRHHQGKDGRLYGQVTFVSCNRELIEDLKLLMISCGLNPLKISSYSRERVLLGQYKGTYTTHYLNLPFSDLEIIRSKPASRPSVEFVRVLSIEPVGEEPVYDIEVEGAHNFVANGLIVHNSRVTMKYPAVYMLGKGAKADILSVAFAGKGQHQDTGGKAIHAAPYTTSTIVSKSVSKDGGRASYRGQLVVAKGAHHAKSNVRCDALLLDERSRSDTYPYIEIDEDQVTIGHEATVGKVGDDQIFYLMSRGLSESEALSMIVLGFMEPFTKTLPMEYAVEFNRLIQLEMEGSVG